jgi:CheY-like chemotaxis protein
LKRRTKKVRRFFSKRKSGTRNGEAKGGLAMNQQDQLSGPPQTILIVDNLEEARGILGGWLARKGYRVVEASSGEEAIEQARRVFPNLILMDIKMPGMDGFGATQVIRGDVELHGVPIVAVSADNTQFYKNMAKEAGVNEYLVKPIEEEELRGVLERLLPQKGDAIH